MSGRYVVSDEFARQFQEMWRRLNGIQPQRSHPQRRQRFTQYPSGIAFYNDSGETIPAFGVMQIYSETTLSDSAGGTASIYVVKKPDTTFKRWYLVNGSDTVANNAYGTGSFCDKADRVLYDSADGTPGVGQVWGPYPSSWKLRRHMYGFRIEGDVVSATTHAKCVQHWIGGMLIGKADSTVTAGSAGTVSVWKGDKSADSTANVSATCLTAITSTTAWLGVTYVSETAYASPLECQ